MQCKRSGHSLFTYVGAIIGVVAAGTIPVAAQDCPWREYAWTRTVGGTDWDSPDGVVLNAAGNLVLCGGFYGKVDFDPNGNGDKRRSHGGADGFVTWYSQEGVYRGTFTLGSNDFDGINALDTDPAGALAVAGYFGGRPDFDPGGGTDRRRARGELDVFVTLLHPDMHRDWTWTAGGATEDIAWDVALGPAGEVYIAGRFTGIIEFGEGQGHVEKRSNGGRDIFVAKLSPQGAFVWAATFGSSFDDYYSVVIDTDAAGNVIVAGTFLGEWDFDPGEETLLRPSMGLGDAYVIALAPTGDLNWVRTIGDIGDDWVGAIEVTGDEVLIGGGFHGSVDFDRDGTGDIHAAGGEFTNAFITKLGVNGDYRWTQVFGGTGYLGVTRINASMSEQLIVGGNYSKAADFDPGPGIDEKAPNGIVSWYVSHWGKAGDYLWTDTFGGDNWDTIRGIAVDPDGNAYLAADFDSARADFDPSWSRDEFECQGGTDVSITKLYCGQCAVVDRHDLVIRENSLISTVQTTVPGGRVELALSDGWSTVRKRKEVGADGTVRAVFRNLASGNYFCVIERVEDSMGEVQCTGSIGRRDVVLPLP